MSLRMPRLVVPAWPRRRPAFMVVVPVVFIIVILHLTGPVTPALATDLVAFGLAALADRWLVASGVGVGVMLVVTLLLPSGWPTLAEYASLDPAGGGPAATPVAAGARLRGKAASPATRSLVTG